MFALVYWTEYKNRSIVDRNNVPANASVGDTALVKYHDGNSYDARIIQFSEDKRYLLAINIDEDSGTVLSPKTNNRKPSKRSNDTKGSVKGVAVQNRKNSMHSVQEHLCEKIRNKKIENIKSNENSISGSSASSHDIKRERNDVSNSGLGGRDSKMPSTQKKNKKLAISNYAVLKENDTLKNEKKIQESEISSMKRSKFHRLRIIDSDESDDEKLESDKILNKSAVLLTTPKALQKPISIDNYRKLHRVENKQHSTERLQLLINDSDESDENVISDGNGDSNDSDDSHKKPGAFVTIRKDSRKPTLIDNARMPQSLDNQNQSTKRRQVRTDDCYESDDNSQNYGNSEIDDNNEKDVNRERDGRKKTDNNCRAFETTPKPSLQSTSIDNRRKRQSSDNVKQSTKRRQLRVDDYNESDNNSERDGGIKTDKNCGAFETTPKPLLESTSIDNRRKRQSSDNVKQTELKKHSGVFVDDTTIELLTQWKFKPREMVRQLISTLVGRKNLRNMTARGSKDKKGIPPQILDAVKYYIDRNAKPILYFSEYIQVINLHIGYLRNKESVDSTKETDCTE